MSLTYSGIATLIISKVMDMAGVQIGNEEITKFIETGLLLVGGFAAFYGRWRKGGVRWFGGRIKA